MIRPLTIASCLLACGSGLYLYQSKHEVQLLDRTIERAVHETNALREQSRLLAAEWPMLNDPERLRQFSDTYLSLKTIMPSQFTSLADLDDRLPAAVTEVPARGTEEQEAVPVAAATVPPDLPDPASASVANDDLPVPPLPATPPATAVASAARPVDARTTVRTAIPRALAVDNQPHSVADARPSDQRLGDQRAAARVVDAPDPGAASSRPIVLVTPGPPLPANGPVDGPSAVLPTFVGQRGAGQNGVGQRGAGPRVADRAGVATARLTPPRQPTVAVAAPAGGSLLGMARDAMPPAPRPTPVNATYNSN